MPICRWLDNVFQTKKNIIATNKDRNTNKNIYMLKEQYIHTDVSIIHINIYSLLEK